MPAGGEPDVVAVTPSRPPAGPKKPPTLGRSMRDVARLVALIGVTALAFLAASVHHVDPVEAAIYRDLAGLPASLHPVSRVFVAFGSPAAIAVVAGAAFYLRRVRLGIGLAVVGAVGWVAGHFTRVFVGPRMLPIVVRGHTEILRTAFPADHMAVAAALYTFASAYLPRSLRRLVPAVLVLVALALDTTGHQLPLDIAAGAAIGWAVATIAALVAGSPGRSVSPRLICHVLETAGVSPASTTVVSAPLRGPRFIDVTTDDGKVLQVELVRSGQRRAGWSYKLRRLLASMELEDEPRLSSPRHEVDHEALVSLLASRAGVRTPRVVLATELGHGPALLVREKVEGRPLSQMRPEEVPEALLDDIWQQVKQLGSARIAHHNLHADNLLIDASGQAWLLDFTFAKAGATPTRLAQDVAETLVSVASVVGAKRAVASASRQLDARTLEEALPYLQPLALPYPIRRQLVGSPTTLAELADLVASEVGAARPSFRPKVRARTLISLFVAGGAVYLLLPQIGTVPRLLSAVEHATYWWLAIATAAGAGTFLASTVSYSGASRCRLPFWRTTLVQLASSFTSRLTPLGMGGIALNMVYLERQSGDRTDAVGTVALNQGAGVVVHATLFFVAAAVIGTGKFIGKTSLPTGWPVLVGVVVVLAAAGLVLGSRFGRQRLIAPLLRVLSNFSTVARQPLRAARLFGGAAGVTICNAFALVASLAAFYHHVSLLLVLAVYVGGAAIASAAPTPGNLGAVEAALAAGLTGIGVPPEPAVAAVLTFRLLTFWLPMVPGMATLRYLEHRNIV